MARQHQSTSDNTSLKEKLLEDFLSCKICLEPMAKPKALPCLHSFCLKCLESCVGCNSANQLDHFPCPMCRKITVVPPGGVDKFPDNFMLRSLADTVKEECWDSNSLNPFKYAPNNSQHRICSSRPQPVRDWYFGKVSRRDAEKWLQTSAKGTFLVRQSESTPDTYTLSVKVKDSGCLVGHYKIFTCFCLETYKECYFIYVKDIFPSLSDLIKYHQEKHIDGLCCKLVSTCDTTYFNTVSDSRVDA